MYDDGKPIYYRVVETKIGDTGIDKQTDYTVTYTNNNGIGPNANDRTVTITNSHTPQTVKLQVEKNMGW